MGGRSRMRGMRGSTPPKQVARLECGRQQEGKQGGKQKQARSPSRAAAKCPPASQLIPRRYHCGARSRVCARYGQTRLISDQQRVALKLPPEHVAAPLSNHLLRTPRTPRRRLEHNAP